MEGGHGTARLVTSQQVDTEMERNKDERRRDTIGHPNSCTDDPLPTLRLHL